MESCNTESSLDLPLESLSLQPFLQSLHKEQWQEVRLGEVAEMNQKNIDKSYPHKTIQYLDTGSIANNKIESLQLFDSAKLPSRAKRIVQNNDIIYSLVRPIQRHFGFIKNPPENLIVSTGFCVITTNNAILDSKFLYYYLTLNEIIELLDMIAEASTSAYPAIRPFDIENLTIPLPPLTIQQKIAEILSSFDDKIDLLHRQNKTLESLALTLFRHYFIDNPKRDEWELGKLGDYVKIVYGKNLPTKNLLPQGYAVFGGNGKIGYFDQYLYDEPQVLISCRGEASGKVNISERKSFITNNSLVLERTKDKEITFEYLKYYCLSYNFDTFVSGSAQPQITIDGLYDAEFIKANQDDILKFSGITSKFENKIENNAKQIQNLQAMRDVLLKAIFA
nr:restriction endonuclease subunit S [uncultured Helicobacter sp.]